MTALALRGSRHHNGVSQIHGKVSAQMLQGFWPEIPPEENPVSAITRYAAELGLAFQIVDDVLDVEGDAKTLGKTAGKDAASAKPSYPALFGIDRSRAMAAECVARAKAALDQAGLTSGWPAPIADWVTGRTS